MWRTASGMAEGLKVVQNNIRIYTKNYKLTESRWPYEHNMFSQSERGKRIFEQLVSFRFFVDGIEFTSMEQFMMYRKAICFGNEAIAKEILASKDVAYIKKLGRLVANYNENIWNGLRQLIVYEGLRAKFTQNYFLKQKLLDTQDAMLAECAVKDRIWGIGLSVNDPMRFDINAWKGKNLLGYSLMMVRDNL